MTGRRLLRPSQASLASRVEQRILLVRGHRVLLDSDLASLYGVPTKALNLAVKRNRKRFPGDFMFQLTAEERNRLKYGFQAESESSALRFQFETSKRRGGRRYPPYAFTEQGVAMLSSVLRSRRAIQVNIAIMRAFVRLRSLLAAHHDLARKLRELEQKYDAQFKVVFDAIRELMRPAAEPPKERIGFRLRRVLVAADHPPE